MSHEKGLFKSPVDQIRSRKLKQKIPSAVIRGNLSKCIGKYSFPNVQGDPTTARCVSSHSVGRLVRITICYVRSQARVAKHIPRSMKAIPNAKSMKVRFDKPGSKTDFDVFEGL